VQGINQPADVVADVAGMQIGMPLVTRVKDVLEIQKDVNDGGVARQWAVPQMID